MKEGHEKEKRCFLSAYKAITGEKGEIKEIPPESDDLGYTSLDGPIFINFSHPVVMELQASARPLFLAGVFAHEMLHHIYTNFAYMNALMVRVDYGKRKVLGLFINVIEDPAIEHFASGKIGGWLLNGLTFTVNSLYEQAPEINPKDTPFTQLINALIQFGDMGIIKGELSEEASVYLRQIAPEFDLMIKEPDSKKRMDAAKRWMELTEPLWKKEEDIENACKKIMQDNGISNSEGNTEGQPGESSGKTDSKKEERKREILQGLKEGKKITVSKEDVELPETPVKQIREAEQIIEDYESELDEARREIAEKASDKAAKVELPEYKGRRCEEITVTATAGDIAGYEEIVSSLRPMIKLFTSSIRSLFLNDYDEEIRAKSGKYNIIRGEMMTSAKIFDRCKEKRNISDVSVCLLVDESGSMTGRNKIVQAKRCAIFLAESFGILGIPCSVIGFSADKNADVEMYKYVSFANKKAERISLSKMSAKYNNFDGASIRYAAEQLKKQKTEQKILFVISDGYPACRSYRNVEEGIKDTTEAIRLTKKQGMHVVGIGIEGSSKVFESMYQGDFTATTPEKLPAELARQLRRILR